MSALTVCSDERLEGQICPCSSVRAYVRICVRVCTHTFPLGCTLCAVLGQCHQPLVRYNVSAGLSAGPCTPPRTRPPLLTRVVHAQISNDSSDLAGLSAEISFSSGSISISGATRRVPRPALSRHASISAAPLPPLTHSLPPSSDRSLTATCTAPL